MSERKPPGPAASGFPNHCGPLCCPRWLPPSLPLPRPPLPPSASPLRLPGRLPASPSSRSCTPWPGHWARVPILPASLSLGLSPAPLALASPLSRLLLSPSSEVWSSSSNLSPLSSPTLGPGPSAPSSSSSPFSLESLALSLSLSLPSSPLPPFPSLHSPPPRFPLFIPSPLLLLSPQGGGPGRPSNPLWSPSGEAAARPSPTSLYWEVPAEGPPEAKMPLAQHPTCGSREYAPEKDWRA